MREEMALQITSMADIFTILLVFLLKSFSTGISNITPGNEMTLPVATTKDQVEEALKIEISEGNILVDDKPATTLKGFKPDPGDVESDGTFRSLNTVLEAQKSQRAPASAPPAGSSTQGESPEDDQQDRPMMILADEKAPYAVIRSVMASAENSGYSQFKLVVVEDQ